MWKPLGPIKMKNYIIAASICLTAGVTAFATPLAPAYDTFGPLTGATFGGTGNPTDPVAIRNITDGNNSITLGLAAQQRYFNPPLTSANGTYFATSGQNNGLGSSSFQGATWNFDFYFNATAGDYTYKLSYGTDASALVTIDPAAIGDNGATPNKGGQNSENLLFPAFGNLSSFQLNSLVFDPNATGTYIFELAAYNRAGDQVGSSDVINVSVRSVPDVSSTAGLLGLGLIGLGLVQFRRNRFASAK
jgi:hypothetical protein